MYDQHGNLYSATYKNGKVVKLENSDSKYVKYEDKKFVHYIVILNWIMRYLN